MTYTYFIANNDSVKIGKTGDVANRYKALLTGSSEPLRLFLVLTGNHERQLHQKFAPFHLRGEWFMLSPEILAFIKNQERLQPIRKEVATIEAEIARRKGPCTIARRKAFEMDNENKRRWKLLERAALRMVQS